MSLFVCVRACVWPSAKASYRSPHSHTHTHEHRHTTYRYSDDDDDDGTKNSGYIASGCQPFADSVANATRSSTVAHTSSIAPQPKTVVVCCVIVVLTVLHRFESNQIHRARIFTRNPRRSRFRRRVFGSVGSWWCVSLATFPRPSSSSLPRDILVCALREIHTYVSDTRTCVADSVASRTPDRFK